MIIEEAGIAGIWSLKQEKSSWNEEDLTDENGFEPNAESFGRPEEGQFDMRTINQD